MKKYKQLDWTKQIAIAKKKSFKSQMTYQFCTCKRKPFGLKKNV